MPAETVKVNPDDLRAIAEKAAKMTDGLVVAPRGPLSAFYAAFNPSTCLALLDELDGLKARVESAEKALRPFAAFTAMMVDEGDHSAIRQIEAVEGDETMGDIVVKAKELRAASAHFTKHPEGKI